MILFYIILILISLNFIGERWLSYKNHLSRMNPIPASLSDVYSQERYRTYQEYKTASHRFNRWVSVLSFTVTLIMVIYGFTALHFALLSINNELIRGLVFFAILGVGSELLFAPFSIYETFIIEKKYGFTTTSAKTYVTDKLKSWILAILLFGGFYSLIYWLYSMFGSDFWWMAWLVISCVSIFLAFFYSTLIVPLFNKQKPLGPGSLRQRLEQLAQKSGFTIDNIYVMDGSKRSTRANAYFSGFGSKRRIVLYDTLIDKFGDEEIAAVVAHEIGHYRKKHVVFSIILSVMSTGIMFWLFSQLVGRPEIYEAMGIDGKPFYLGIILFGLLYTPVSIMLSLGSNYISRRFEFQADAFASSLHYAINLQKALKKLAADDLTDLTPDPAYVFVHYSHPPLAQRLNHLEKLL